MRENLTMSSLPGEIVAMIYSHLNIMDKINLLHLTSYLGKDFVFSITFENVAICNEFFVTLNENANCYFPSSHSTIPPFLILNNELSFLIKEDYTGDYLTMFEPINKHIRRVNMFNFQNPAGDSLCWRIVNRFTNLLELQSVDDVPLKNDEIMLRSLKLRISQPVHLNLKYLRQLDVFMGARDISLSTLEIDWYKLPNLMSLKVSSSAVRGGFPIFKNTNKYLREYSKLPLERLIVYSGTFDGGSSLYQSLSKIESLKFLKLHGYLSEINLTGIESIKSLITLHCSCMKLNCDNYSNKVIELPSQLNTLILSDLCTISNVGDEDLQVGFTGCESTLTALSIVRWDEMTSLEPFENYVHLESLELIKCKVGSFDSLSRKLQNLKTFIIDGTNLEINDWIYSFKKLNRLELQRCSLNFDFDYAKMPSLEYLDVPDLPRISNANTTSTSNIQEITISEGSLFSYTIMPNHFQHLLRLKITVAKAHFLKLESLPNLLDLSIIGNSLKRIELKLPNLKHFFLNASSIQTLDNIKCEAQRLEVAKIERCSLTDISGSHWLSNVKHLSLSSNLIKSLGSKIRSFERLEKLEVKYNNLRSIEIKSEPKTLNVLDASFNKITNATIKNFVNLVTLNLSYNELTSLDNFSDLPALAYLNASHNRLERFSNPDSFPNLIQVWLSANDIHQMNCQDLESNSNVKYLLDTYTAVN